MKQARFAETQIAAIVQQQKTGHSVKELSRGQAISEVGFYNGKARYNVMEMSDMKKMKDPEEENSRLNA